MHQALPEKVFYSDIIPSGQPMEKRGECDDCFVQLQKYAQPQSAGKAGTVSDSGKQ